VRDLWHFQHRLIRKVERYQVERHAGRAKGTCRAVLLAVGCPQADAGGAAAEESREDTFVRSRLQSTGTRENSREGCMDFYTVMDEAIDLLRRRGKVAYRALKRQFDLDDEYLEDLKDALLYAHPVVDDGRGLIWTGEAPPVIPPAVVPLIKSTARSRAGPDWRHHGPQLVPPPDHGRGRAHRLDAAGSPNQCRQTNRRLAVDHQAVDAR